MAQVGTAGTRPRPRRHPRRHPIDVVALALLAYVPFLLSSPGRLASDTKQYLYLDPGRFLTRVPYLWDSSVAAGTVPHQQLGYLFPMGPFFWLLDTVGVPDWVAQRLWLGTISLAAALGARWLFRSLGLRRSAALVGAVVYVLTPYQLAFTARISVLLLPWAALPWVVGLTMRAARRAGWRDPAAIALIVLAAGSVNASALVLMAVGPAIWIVGELLSGRDRARAAGAATLRIALLTLGASAWWLAGLYLQGSRGLPVLALTENVRTVSSAASPGDVLRGLGNWFFYGFDRAGPSLVQTNAYLIDRTVVIASFAVPVTAFLAATFLRWRHRAYFAACAVVGTLIAVGSWPYDETTPWGRLWKAFTSETSVGLALRNSPRVVPVVVLGVAGLLAAAVAALTPTIARRIGAVVVVVGVALAFLPVWQDGALTPGSERPNDVPQYWKDAVAALDRGSHATRILELPGSAFATYRWGNAVEPITPGLTSRPYLAREVLPAGSPQSVNLLDAFDRRIQNGSFEGTALAPLARLLGVGTVSVRNDLAYERSGSPHPKQFWSALTDPRAPGLAEPRVFGRARTNQAPGRDGIDLRTDSAAPDPPAVALFPVTDARPIVRAAPDRNPVVLAGDGDGIVDTAAAGLLTGRERVLALADLTDAALTHALDTGAALVLTDSNRRRDSSWFSSIRDTKGPTQRAGQTTGDIAGYDARVDLFRDRSDRARTVVETSGGVVTASADGGSGRPEDRATAAFDGELRTAWRVGGPNPLWSWIAFRPEPPVTTDHVTLVQPLGLPRDRWITQVRVTVNDRPPLTVELGDASSTPDGQRVDFARTRVRELKVEITGLHEPPFDPQFSNAVGFAEIRLGSARVTETVRVPVDLAGRVGAGAVTHPVAVVLSRLRQETALDGRLDEELALRRRVVLPDRRSFALSGTARVNPDAPGAVIDEVLGTTTPGVRYEASSHLAGDPAARASRAFTGDLGDAWTTAIGPQVPQWVRAALATPATVDRVSVTVLADRYHSAPTALTVGDGPRVLTTIPVHVPESAATAATPTPVVVTGEFPATSVQSLDVTIVGSTPPPGAHPTAATIPPIALSSITAPGIPPAPATGTVAGACRDDLVRVDGQPFPVRIVGAASDARRGLAIESCADPVTLAAGSHTVTTPRGWDTGVDVDRIVLTSGRTGQAVAPGPLVTRTPSGPELVVRESAPDHLRVRATTDGSPFWLALGQSHSTGWHATADGHDLGAPSLVDGYANAWLIRPDRAGTVTISLRWTPQRYVWIGLAVSAAAAILCVVLLLVRRRRRATAADLAVAPLPLRLWPAATARAWSVQATLLAAAAAFVVTWAFSRPKFALLTAAATAVTARFPRLRPVLGIAAAVLLAASRVRHEPEWSWLALAWFAATVLVTSGPDEPDRAPETPASA